MELIRHRWIAAAVALVLSALKDPHWRAIRDNHGRVMVMINFNNDLGDSWQLADNPEYPQTFSYLGIRLGVNYVIYTMTH